MLKFKYFPHCKNCGEEFPAKKENAEFCTGRCRVAWHRKYKKKESKAISGSQSARMTKSLRVSFVTCLFCNANIRVTGNTAMRKYCNDACQQADYRKRKFIQGLIDEWLSG